MAIGRITGPMLFSNLDRQGVNLSIDGNLIYADVTLRNIGINNSYPQYPLDVTGNAHLGNIYILGNTISSDSGTNVAGLVSFTGTTNSTSINSGVVVVAGGQGIAKDLWVGGNIYANSIVATSTSILSIADPLLYLNASNPSTYNYETGFFGHFVGGSTNTYQHTGLVRNHTDNYWYVFSNAAEPSGSTVNLSNAFIILDTIKSGGLILANTTPTSGPNTGALQVAGGASVQGALWITNTGDVSANIGSYMTGVNSISANLGAFQTYANTRIQTHDANIGTITNSIQTVNANLGLYQNTTNANIGTITNSIQTVNANIGNYQIITNANIGAFHTYANATFATASGPSTQSISANLGAYQIYANANASTLANSINNIQLQSYSNSNVASYLPIYSGNVSASNIIVSSLYTNTIYSNTSGVVVFASNTAIGLPVGSNVARPSSPQSGWMRFNSDLSALEFYTGLGWQSLTNTITGQVITGDNVNATYTLNNATTTSGILVSINGTVQQPGIAYSVTGNQITFAEVPQATDIIDVRFLGAATTSITNTTTINPTAISLTANVSTVIDSFDSMVTRSAKYTISSTSAVDAHMADVKVIQFNSLVTLNAFGILNTGANTINYSANISGTTVYILANSTTSSNLRIQSTYFSV